MGLACHKAMSRTYELTISLSHESLPHSKSEEFMFYAEPRLLSLRSWLSYHSIRRFRRFWTKNNAKAESLTTMTYDIFLLGCVQARNPSTNQGSKYLN